MNNAQKVSKTDGMLSVLTLTFDDNSIPNIALYVRFSCFMLHYM